MQVPNELEIISVEEQDIDSMLSAVIDAVLAEKIIKILLTLPAFTTLNPQFFSSKLLQSSLAALPNPDARGSITTLKSQTLLCPQASQAPLQSPSPRTK